MPNGHAAKIEHIGSIQIGPNLILRDVLHVPDFQFNLLSISKLTKKTGLVVIFSLDSCILLDPILKKVVDLGKEEMDVYCSDTT